MNIHWYRYTYIEKITRNVFLLVSNIPHKNLEILRICSGEKVVSSHVCSSFKTAIYLTNNL